MVNQISVQQAKYKLLTDVRQPRSKLQALCFILIILIFLLLFTIYTSIGILPLKSSNTSNFHKEDDAKISTWIRRTWLYAESTKKNQNAEKSTIFDQAEQPRKKSLGKIIACYFTIPRNLNTSGELSPSQLDPNLCTHIIVGFASVVNCTLSLGENISMYREVVNLKIRKPKLKIMVSVGGTNELYSGFPEMVETHTNRKKFINSVLNVTKNLNLDGLDIDWEFPAWPDSKTRQKIHFVQLLQELQKVFDRTSPNLILSVALGAPPAIIAQSYNVPQLAQHVDFVNLMTYDYHFFVWYFPITGLNAPLYPRSPEIGYLSTLNVNYSAYYLLSKGMPREKIVIGIPTYGHSYKLDNSLNHEVGSPAKSFGTSGSAGFVPYSTTCKFLHSGAETIFEHESRVPYTYKNDEWISYDDILSVKYKIEWILKSGFKGAMIFSLNTDDWYGSCADNTTFPLTRITSSILKHS
ncbi:chitinase-3-like protein 2 isoform X2 [Cephus cinctus]|uniref:Chitinase-3-like protein 2 isoform X2 n=1 Tax=Cephus cinctus TaxID=211228 RepID=A0AAJ7C4A4_CEPCN|nr:chitinase-3-like protein 2 isoform X2 [Cephus cinctus]